MTYTREYLEMKTKEDLAKSEAKKLRYCGLNAKAHSDWEKNVFAVKIYNLSQEDYATLLNYQETGAISNKIQILRMA